jgi:hypothetical protein
MTGRELRQGGIPLTDELLDRLADEAEAGFAPEQLRRVGRPRIEDGPGRGPSPVVHVRVGDELARRLTDRAERDGTTVSEVVRTALVQHLDGLRRAG